MENTLVVFLGNTNAPGAETDLVNFVKLTCENNITNFKLLINEPKETLIRKFENDIAPKSASLTNLIIFITSHGLEKAGNEIVGIQTPTGILNLTELRFGNYDGIYIYIDACRVDTRWDVVNTLLIDEIRGSNFMMFMGTSSGQACYGNRYGSFFYNKLLQIINDRSLFKKPWSSNEAILLMADVMLKWDRWDKQILNFKVNRLIREKYNDIITTMQEKTSQGPTEIQATRINLQAQANEIEQLKKRLREKELEGKIKRKKALISHEEELIRRLKEMEQILKTKSPKDNEKIIQNLEKQVASKENLSKLKIELKQFEGERERLIKLV